MEITKKIINDVITSLLHTFKNGKLIINNYKLIGSCNIIMNDDTIPIDEINIVKDLDIAIQFIDDDEILSIEDRIKSIISLTPKKFTHNIKDMMNIINIEYIYNDIIYPIDIMIAETTQIFDYQTNLYFYNNETHPLLKGMHRTELLKYILFNKGINMHNKGLAKYKIKSNITDILDIISEIENNFDSTYTIELKSIINNMNYKKMNDKCLTDIIPCDTHGYISNLLTFIDLFELSYNDISIFIFELLTDEFIFSNTSYLTIINEVYTTNFDLNTLNSYVSSYSNLMHFITFLYDTHRITRIDVDNIIKFYIHALSYRKYDNYYNKYIINTFHSLISKL